MFLSYVSLRFPFFHLHLRDFTKFNPLIVEMKQIRCNRYEFHWTESRWCSISQQRINAVAKAWLDFLIFISFQSFSIQVHAKTYVEKKMKFHWWNSFEKCLMRQYLKNVKIQSIFRSIFFAIWIEYEDSVCKTLFWVQVQEKTNYKNPAFCCFCFYLFSLYLKGH